MLRLDQPAAFSLTLSLQAEASGQGEWDGDRLAVPLGEASGAAKHISLVAVDNTLLIKGAWVSAVLTWPGGLDAAPANLTFDGGRPLLTGTGWQARLAIDSECPTEAAPTALTWRRRDSGAGDLVLGASLLLDNDAASGVATAALDDLLDPQTLEGKLQRQDFDDIAPPSGLSDVERQLWRHLWLLHRIATYEPSGFQSHFWQDPGRGYFRPLFGHWDTLHSALEWLWNDPARAEGLMRDYFTLWDDETGMVGMRWSPAQKSHPRPWTTPPLWAVVAWRVYLHTSNLEFLRLAYQRCRHNLEWWEKNRRFSDGPLFYYLNVGETGYDNMARGDWGDDISQMPDFAAYAPIDLNCQMAEYYGVTAEMAKALGDTEAAASLTDRSQAIAEAVRRRLWDPGQGFFFDLHAASGVLQPAKTIAAFWALTCGVATSEQARALVGHLTDPREFWTPYPMPTTAVDEPTFQLDMWRGPVWSSQNYWIALGLRRYGRPSLAAELARKTWRMVLDGYSRTGRVFEFYDPFVSDERRLRRKGSPSGPCPYYIGHNPLHCLLIECVYGAAASLRGLEVAPPDALGQEGQQLGSLAVRWRGEQKILSTRA